LNQQLQISEPVARRTVESEVIRNVGIPSSLPSAERVVSVNARLEITEATAGTGSIVYSGIIRSTIYYASQDDPSNVVSIRRNFNFTERVSVPGARPGNEVNVDGIISDIDFYLINDRLIGVEYLVTSDIEITSAERITFVNDIPDVEIRRQKYRIRKELKEQNYRRQFTSLERISDNNPDIKREINIDSDIQLIDITAGEDRVIVRGIVRSDFLYLSTTGKVEYTQLEFPFEESFVFRGVSSEMSPFVEVNIINEEVNKIDERRVRLNINVLFKVLVVVEEVVEIPTEIVSPVEVFPVRRTVIVERIVAEERTRIQARGQIQILESSPDIDRIIRASGRLEGGSLVSEAVSAGVSLSGVVDVNVIYVANLPDQPVYFASDDISFNYFVDIPEVNADMNVFADVKVLKTEARKINEREIEIRAILDVNILVTEDVRVSIIVDVSETPAGEVDTGFIFYTVRQGDTLYLIAQRYGVSVNRLISINNISNPNQLKVGQRLRIPRS